MKREKELLLFVVTIVAVTLLFLGGCTNVQTLGKNLSGGQAENQTMMGKTSRSNFKQVWAGCLDALPDIYFSATSTDYASGMIIAERRVIGSDDGKVSRLNIRIEKSGKEVIINVNHIPPAGLLIIGGNETMNLYVEALKKESKAFKQIIPDKAVAEVNLKIIYEVVWTLRAEHRFFSAFFYLS